VIRRAVLPAATVVCIGAAVLGLRWATTTQLAAARAGIATFDDVVGLVAAVACWALLGWTAMALAVTALGSVPGSVGRRATDAAVRLVPAATRRAARFVLGLAVVAGPVGTASAASAAQPPTRVVATVDRPSTVSDVLLLPDVGRPRRSGSVGPAADTDAGGIGSHRQPQTTVVVRPGDCLWTIAARFLGPDTSDAEIAAEWPRWYALNRHVIGADPDLLLPGTSLRTPIAR
jgi:nucleoid-associated protein YgaU